MKEMTHTQARFGKFPACFSSANVSISVRIIFSLKSDWPNGREQALLICEIIGKHFTLRQEMLVTHALNFIFTKHFHQWLNLPQLCGFYGREGRERRFSLSVLKLKHCSHNKLGINFPLKCNYVTVHYSEAEWFFLQVCNWWISTCSDWSSVKCVEQCLFGDLYSSLPLYWMKHSAVLQGL